MIFLFFFFTFEAMYGKLETKPSNNLNDWSSLFLQSVKTLTTLVYPIHYHFGVMKVMNLVSMVVVAAAAIRERWHEAWNVQTKNLNHKL